MGRKKRLSFEAKDAEKLRFAYQHSKFLIFLVLFGIILVGACYRLNHFYLQSEIHAEYGRYLLRNDDVWWHYHWMLQVEQYGHRLNPDPYSWAPEGRLVGHPPLFHYLLPYLRSLILPWMPLYDLVFYFPVLAGIIGIVVVFLLCRELYGAPAGLAGACLYSTAWIFASKTFTGGAHPTSLAEPSFLFGLLLFFYACRTGKKLLYPLPGVIIGFAALFWEGALLFYIPLFAAFWLASTLFRTADRRFHLLAAITVSISLGIAASWFLPVYLNCSFGHQNTPPSQTALVLWFAGGELLLDFIRLTPVFILSVLGLVFLALRLLFHKREKRDVLTSVWMVVGLGASLLFGGRMITIFLVYGMLLIIAASFSKFWHTANLGGKVRLGVLMTLILMGQFAWNVHLTYTTGSAGVDGMLKRYLPVMNAMGTTIPEGGTVISWWFESAFLTAIGARTVWDLYMEHLPTWHRDRGRQVASFFLTTSETEALRIAHQLNATYVLVDMYYAKHPLLLSNILLEHAPNADPESYFTMNSPITETRPKILMIHGQPTIVQNQFEDVIVGYEFAPTAKGRQTMLARLIWNKETGNMLRQASSMPKPPQHFKFAWKSSDSQIMIYKILQTS